MSPARVPWPDGFSRAAVIGWIEEASECRLHIADALPDTLIAEAQALGLRPDHLKIWICDCDWSDVELVEDRAGSWALRPVGLVDWRGDTLADWARRVGLVRE
jgi:hypothetical protein